jgi:hypothetical protein
MSPSALEAYRQILFGQEKWTFIMKESDFFILTGMGLKSI